MPSEQFNLSFSSEDLDTINQAMMELPYRLAAPLIAKINKQILEQRAAVKKDAESD